MKADAAGRARVHIEAAIPLCDERLVTVSVHHNVRLDERLRVLQTVYQVNAGAIQLNIGVKWEPEVSQV
jgi:hypothetical protein